MIFLKRLENNGVKVVLSREDRNLLKNYGTTQAEEDKEKEIERAFREDTKGGKDDIVALSNELAGLANAAQSMSSMAHPSAAGPSSSALGEIDQATLEKLKLR